VLSETWAWLLAALATWRTTHLLWAEEGPFGWVARLRGAISRVGQAGSLFDCFYCLSVWVGFGLAALVLALQNDGAWLTLHWPIAGLGLSGAAILIERLNPQPLPPTPPLQE
jgi:hypothetical protein